MTDGPDAFKQLEENAHAELSKLVEAAPSQIKGPVTTLVNAENQFFDALKAADFDVTKVGTTAHEFVQFAPGHAGHPADRQLPRDHVRHQPQRDPELS